MGYLPVYIQYENVSMVSICLRKHDAKNKRNPFRLIKVVDAHEAKLPKCFQVSKTGVQTSRKSKSQCRIILLDEANDVNDSVTKSRERDVERPHDNCQDDTRK